MAEETREFQCPRCEQGLTDAEIGKLWSALGGRKRKESGRLGGRPARPKLPAEYGSGHIVEAPKQPEPFVEVTPRVNPAIASLRSMMERVEKGDAPRFLDGDVLRYAGAPIVNVPGLDVTAAVREYEEVRALDRGDFGPNANGYLLPRDEPRLGGVGWVSPFDKDAARKQGTGWREKLAELEAMEPGWAAEAMAEALHGVKLPGKWSSMKREARVEWLEENSPMGAK